MQLRTACYTCCGISAGNLASLTSPSHSSNCDSASATGSSSLLLHHLQTRCSPATALANQPCAPSSSCYRTCVLLTASNFTARQLAYSRGPTVAQQVHNHKLRHLPVECTCSRYMQFQSLEQPGCHFVLGYVRRWHIFPVSDFFVYWPHFLGFLVLSLRNRLTKARNTLAIFRKSLPGARNRLFIFRDMVLTSFGASPIFEKSPKTGQPRSLFSRSRAQRPRQSSYFGMVPEIAQRVFDEFGL